MAATLARASGPFNARKQRGRAIIEKTRSRNPNRLTVNQHVFPSKSIERFTGQGKRVSVYDLHRNEIFRARPGNPVFLAFRAWDQRAESGYMKRIEDEFQNIVAPIVDGRAESIAPEAKVSIDRMYALWHTRSRQREIESQEIQLNVAPGNDYTKEQEENLEKNGYLFVRKGGGIPTRQLNGIELVMRANDLALDLAGRVQRWGGHLDAIRRAHRAGCPFAWHHSCDAMPGTGAICAGRNDYRKKPRRNKPSHANIEPGLFFCAGFIEVSILNSLRSFKFRPVWARLVTISRIEHPTTSSGS